jgi:hypothetical protein
VGFRKPVLLIDDTENSRLVSEILKSSDIEFVEYHITKFEDNCCAGPPTTRAPALFAPEGIFRDLDGIKEYLTVEKNNSRGETSESAYW